MRTSCLLLVALLFSACSNSRPQPAAPVPSTPVAYDAAQTETLQQIVREGIWNRGYIAWIREVEGTDAADEIATDDELALHIPDLLQAGADPNVQAEEGYTALLYAALRNDMALAETLLTHRADPNLANRYGYTAFDMAEQDGRTDFARLLQQHGAGPEQNAASRALRQAIRDNDEQAALRALDAGANPNTALRATTDLQGFDYLPALQWSAERRYGPLALRLVEAGADPNVWGWDRGTPLMTASATGDVALVRALLDAGAEVNVSAIAGADLTALMEAARQNQAEIVRLLIEAGAEIEQEDIVSRTALHFAVWQNSLAAARALLEAGADPYAQTVEGLNAFEIAEERGHAEMHALLEAFGGE